MATKSFQVSNYTLQVGFKSTASSPAGTILIQGVLVCNGADGTRFAIYGLHPSSPVPAPVYNEATKWGTIFIPFKELREYVDIVRNEKPVYAYLNSVNPDWNNLSTSTEPIGEGE